MISSISKQILWERKSGFVDSGLGAASDEPDKFTNSSDVFTIFFSNFSQFEQMKKKTNILSVQNSFFSQFASCKRNHNKYLLEKKSYNRNSDDWWNHLMNSFEIYRNIPGILQTKYFWRFDNAPMFKAMWLTVKDPSTNLLTEALSTKKKNVMKYKKIYY